MKLNLGELKYNGFENIDKNFNKLKFDDKSIDSVYSCYLFHKLSKEETLKIFLEIKRILKQGGQIRFSVPDYFLLADKYLKSKCKIEEVNRILADSKQFFDFTYMQKLLVQSGFYAIKRYNQEKYPMDDFSAYDINGEIISLNIEAYG